MKWQKTGGTPRERVASIAMVAEGRGGDVSDRLYCGADKASLLFLYWLFVIYVVLLL